MAIFRGTGGSVGGITDADILLIAVSQGGTGASTASGARTNLGLGTAATTDSSAYATAAQGALADTALQSFTETDPVFAASEAASITSTDTTNWDTAYTDRLKWDGGSTGLNASTARTSLGLGTAATTDATAYATSAQGAKADSAVQPGSLATVATSGSYNDLSNKPTIPTNLDSLTDVVITSASTNQVLQYNGTNWINGSVSGAGTVTSVAMSVPTGLSISGSPITSSGTLAVTYASGYSIPTTTKQTEWDTAYTDRLNWDGGSTGLTASTGRTSLGATTVGSNLFTLTNPSAITFPRFNADNTVSTLSASDFRTAIGAGTGSGTVTSVSGAGTVNGLTLTGTVTSSGSLTLGGTLDLSSPPAIGGTTPAAGTFNSLSLATDGTASAPSVTRSGDTNTGIFFPAADTVALATGGSERWRVDSSGNLGVGTTSPDSIITFAGNITSKANDNYGIGTNGGNNHFNVFATGASGAVRFWTGGSSATSVGGGGTERARIDSSGNLLVGTTSNGNSAKFLVVGGANVGDLQAGFGGTNGTSARLYHADAGGSNAANTVFKVEKVSATGRSINAAGTINASGADYAEYMTKSGEFTVAKGDVVGINAEGKLTNVFADAVSFCVKSTDPSYVGGDAWGAGFEEDPDGLELARQKVDRIAFAGQVPVNVLGANAGQYIVPVNDNGAIKGEAVSNPTFEQYQIAVGKVIAIEQDGRARIIVKVA